MNTNRKSSYPTTMAVILLVIAAFTVLSFRSIKASTYTSSFHIASGSVCSLACDGHSIDQSDAFTRHMVETERGASKPVSTSQIDTFDFVPTGEMSHPVHDQPIVTHESAGDHPIVVPSQPDTTNNKTCKKGGDNWNRNGKHNCSNSHPNTNSGQLNTTSHNTHGGGSQSQNNGKGKGHNK